MTASKEAVRGLFSAEQFTAKRNLARLATMPSSRRLLCFAYKAEASEFLSCMGGQLLNQAPVEIYESRYQGDYLLITGEGAMRAALQCSRALAYLNRLDPANVVTSVHNYGIAGSLQDQLRKGAVYDFAVIIGEGAERQPEFRSFPTPQSSGAYLITALQRVKEMGYAQSLSLFADAVDREAWGLAYASQQYGLEFYCHKVISDRAGVDSDCFDIRQQASEYSQKLYAHYQHQYPTVLAEAGNRNEPANHEDNFSSLSLHSDFFFSLNQKRQFEKMSKILRKHHPQSYEQIFAAENLRAICREHKHPKQRSRILLEEMQAELNPFSQAMDQILYQCFRSKPESVKQLQTDPQWETEKIQIQLEIRNARDLAESLEFLQNLPLEKYHDFFRGRLEA